jgi:hypothetical protein
LWIIWRILNNLAQGLSPGLTAGMHLGGQNVLVLRSQVAASPQERSLLKTCRQKLV